MFEPVIKWSGSKRPIAKEIVDMFPREIGTYYEPFCGGASVMRRLLDEIGKGNVKVGKIVCSDLNDGLINLWNKVKNEPKAVSEHYRMLWHEMNLTDDKAVKREYFQTVRERFNKGHDPLDFMFIMRTCTNGMPRYNKDGDFNNSFHITRDGITPDKLDAIIMDWSSLLREYDVAFKCQPFEEVSPVEGDLLFCDPPYANTSGMYFGGFDNGPLFKWLSGMACKWLMTYDGKSGDTDNTYAVPDGLYERHIYLKSGNSSFKRTIGKSNNSIVYESLYLNY